MSSKSWYIILLLGTFIGLVQVVAPERKANAMPVGMLVPVPYENGAPAGFTGSPSDGQTCAKSTCHGGTATFVPGWISTNVPVSGYVPGSSYQVTATVTDSGRNKFGFELSPQDLSGNLLGTLQANAVTDLRGLGKYITHRNSSTSGQDSKSWTFNWVAPPAGTGEVTFYAAFNGANGNGQSSGDNIYRSSLVVEEDTTVVGVDDDALVVIPNPSNGWVTLRHPDLTQWDFQVRVYTIDGKLVYSKNVFANDLILNLAALEDGMYQLTVDVKGGTLASWVRIVH